MELWLLLIVLGIILALLVNYVLGVILIVVGLCLLVIPLLRTRR